MFILASPFPISGADASLIVTATPSWRPRFFGRPAYDLFEEGFAGAIHTAGIQVIVRLDIFQPFIHKALLLYTKQLRMTHREE